MDPLISNKHLDLDGADVLESHVLQVLQATEDDMLGATFDTTFDVDVSADGLLDVGVLWSERVRVSSVHFKMAATCKIRTRKPNSCAWMSWTAGMMTSHFLSYS